MTPSVLMETTIRAMVSTTEVKLDTKDATVLSVLRASKYRLSAFLTRPISQMPTTYISMATSILSPKWIESTATWCIAVAGSLTRVSAKSLAAARTESTLLVTSGVGAKGLV